MRKIGDRFRKKKGANICIPRPIERSASADGGPLRYCVVHRASLWKAGEAPKLERHVIEGDVELMT